MIAPRPRVLGRIRDVDVTRRERTLETPAGPIGMGMAPATKRWFTSIEAAAYLGITDRTLMDWRQGRRGGHAIPYSMQGRFPRYQRTDLDAHLGRNRVAGKPRRRRTTTPPPGDPSASP